MGLKSYAFFSVPDRDRNKELVRFAKQVEPLVGIASCGETARFLRAQGVKVASVSLLARMSLVHRLRRRTSMNEAQCQQTANALDADVMLGHRVALLRPEIMGPLLATWPMNSELEENGMSRIIMVRTGFCLPTETPAGSDPNAADVFEQADIDGPAVVMAAVKGGRLAVVDSADHEEAYVWLTHRRSNEAWEQLNAKAVRRVSEYHGQLADFFERRVQPVG
jgi:AICAR transformylase/IMP cyclohydrolase PurH